MQDVVVAVVHRQGQFAYLQRHGGRWTFPSGKIEDGETVEAAALREAAEETGLAVKVVRDLGMREMDGNRLVYRLCDYVSGELELREPDKFSCAIWASPLMVLSLAGHSIHEPVAEMLKSKMNQCHCQPMLQ